MWRRLRARWNSCLAGSLLKHLAGRSQLDRVGVDVLNSQVAQRLLYSHYRSQALNARALGLAETGFRVFSQADEDGLLLYVFATVGFETRVCVDFGFASPYGANTTNLICNWGFTGLLVEGDPQLFTGAEAFFQKHADTCLHPPSVLHAWVNAENCNDLLVSHGVAGPIDLLSIDLDGVDYWIWKALTAVTARVVIIECQDIWGADRSVTVPYSPDFKRPGPGYEYCGASLPALVKLGRQKGYRLVGTNRYGYNAIFVRSGLGEEALPELAAENCFGHARARQRRQRQGVAGRFPWEEV